MQTLVKTFPHVDKVCDAPFLKKITGITTKKDACRFILENPDCRAFFMQMEQVMIQSNHETRNKIAKYFTTVPEPLARFKNQLKLDRQKEKIDRDNSKRDALKDELRRELELEQQAAQTRTELNLPVTPVEKTDTQDGPDDTPIYTPEMAASSSSSSSSSAVHSTQRELGLEEFHEYLKAVIDEDLLNFVDQNNEKIQIKQIVFDQKTISVILDANKAVKVVKTPIRLIRPTVS